MSTRELSAKLEARRDARIGDLPPSEEMLAEIYKNTQPRPPADGPNPVQKALENLCGAASLLLDETSVLKQIKENQATHEAAIGAMMDRVDQIYSMQETILARLDALAPTK